jgi:hypothetical protein
MPKIQFNKEAIEAIKKRKAGVYKRRLKQSKKGAGKKDEENSQDSNFKYFGCVDFMQLRRATGLDI